MSLDRETLSGAVVELEREMKDEPSARFFAPLAEAYRLQGRLEDAIRVAETGLLSNPDHIAIRLVLARALTDCCRDEEARKAYDEVARLDPDNAEARAFTGLIEAPGAQGEGDRGDASSDELTLKEPISLSAELAHLSELFSERRCCPEPLAQDPDEIATLTLAEIYARQGLPDKAVEVCERILARDPDDEEAARRLGEYRNELASAR